MTSALQKNPGVEYPPKIQKRATFQEESFKRYIVLTLDF